MPEIVNKLTVQDLYTNHKERFGLEWIAGQHGGNSAIFPEERGDSTSIKADDGLNNLKNLTSGKNHGPTGPIHWLVISI